LIEVDTELSMAERVGQAGNTTRSLVGAICESRINYWAAYATDFSCPCIFAISWNAPCIELAGDHFQFAAWTVFLQPDRICGPSLAPSRSEKRSFLPARCASQQSRKDLCLPFSHQLLAAYAGLVFLTWGLHFQQASYFLMGLSGGYFYYDTLHHVEHTRRINQIPFRWLKKRWAFHSVHHRIEQSNFGVISSFWDHVFGTHQKQIKRRQSRA
jgi:hypothetical protein